MIYREAKLHLKIIVQAAVLFYSKVMKADVQQVLHHLPDLVNSGVSFLRTRVPYLC